MITYRQLVHVFRQLKFDRRNTPVIVHSSLSAFGKVQGGAETVAGALFAEFPKLIAPSFTYKTMVVPELGPQRNALEYGKHSDANRMAEFFRPDTPADRLIGILAETIRAHPSTDRSKHPILSFTGRGVNGVLTSQDLQEPFAPLYALMDQDGWVLLLGVDHRANTSIHLGERLAGRRTFVRWGLSTEGVQQCINFPSCSEGFETITPHVTLITQRLRIGRAQVLALPIRGLVDMTQALIADNPYALLCKSDNCPRCRTLRAELETRPLPTLSNQSLLRE
ncbi:MAG: aminoglycoside N(3)-acetyltransferase [Chloroflexi bacterium]|nr:MAG: aminoglycoside N(3)-acetyltransferase [Chloroflexota bacterium]MBL1192858.1 aminoglycoside N(3)-acetyltransferase [Chloroflexota bacterium]NOH10151.1 AAC(3) family N-acetyltransferase [Chloroflexota bacterium]